MTKASKEAPAAVARKPKSKGRQRIAMALIVNKARRHVTFSKRKAGLLNKARELAQRYDAHVAVILFSAAGKVFTFGSPSVDSVLRRLAPLPGEEEGAPPYAAAEPRKEDARLARARTLEPWHQQYQTQMPGNGGARLTDMSGFQSNATGMGSNAMDNTNNYLYQKPRLAGDHYEYFTDDMAGFQMQAPGSNANAEDDDVWPNLCGGIDDWSCDAVMAAEYPSMEVAAGSSSSYKPAGDDNFAGLPDIGQGCNFVGKNSYDYETQCLLHGDLHCPDATSNCDGLDEQLNYLSDLAEGFVFLKQAEMEGAPGLD